MIIRKIIGTILRHLHYHNINKTYSQLVLKLHHRDYSNSAYYVKTAIMQINTKLKNYFKLTSIS